MPQASAELDKWARDKFGGIDDAPVIAFLKGEGFTLTRGWEWKKAGITEWNQLTDDQKCAINFLVGEWDFGGLITEKPAP